MELAIHPDGTLIIYVLNTGAIVYLIKDGAFDELVTAIHPVTKRQPFLS